MIIEHIHTGLLYGSNPRIVQLVRRIGERVCSYWKGQLCLTVKRVGPLLTDESMSHQRSRGKLRADIQKTEPNG